MIPKTYMAESVRRPSRRRFDWPLPEASRTRFRASMNAEASPKVLESLQIIARHVSASPADAPVEFVRELAQRWKDRGGYLSGKPRHSDRYLDDLLRWQGTPIRSLTPKLVGRTNLKPADADVLIRLFLSHWDYVGDPNSGEITASTADVYQPLLLDAQIEEVCGY